MPQYDISEVDAPAVVPVRSRCANSPQRFSHEFFGERSIEVSFPEIWPEIIPLEVCEEGEAFPMPHLPLN